MVLLLVDDRDGRIVAEVETEREAQRVLGAWATDDGNMPDYLCLVELRSHRGAIVGTDTSVKVRPLPHLAE
jgi:hypothetical protein